MLAGDVGGNVHLIDFLLPNQSLYDLKSKKLEKAIEVDLSVSKYSVSFYQNNPFKLCILKLKFNFRN